MDDGELATAYSQTQRLPASVSETSVIGGLVPVSLLTLLVRSLAGWLAGHAVCLLLWAACRDSCYYGSLMVGFITPWIVGVGPPVVVLYYTCIPAIKPISLIEKCWLWLYYHYKSVLPISGCITAIRRHCLPCVLAN